MSKIAIIGDIQNNIKQMYQQLDSIEKEKGIMINTVIQLGVFFHIHKKANASDTGSINDNNKISSWSHKANDTKNIDQNYFHLGRSGVEKIDDLNIGWLSGNYTHNFFIEGERKEYNHFTKKDIKKIINNKNGIEILLFHEWPNIRKFNTKKSLKPGYIDTQIITYAVGTNIGSKEAYDVINNVAPKFVFASGRNMPIDIQTYIGKRKIRFVGLSRLGIKGSIYLLDKNERTIEPYNTGQKEYLFKR